jgi:hypothetical protein
MHISLKDATVDQLRSADVIVAVDPAKASSSVQLFGQESMARGRTPGSTPYELKVLEVEFDSSDASQLLSLLKRVEEAKGGLPRIIKGKRTSLADWAEQNAEHWGEQFSSENGSSFTNRSS